MKIGELSHQAGCRPETIRFYEQQGVLAAPRRTGSGYRDYEPEHLEELLFVRHCRALGLTLEETRELLQLRRVPDKKCDEANRLLERRLEQVREQLRCLRRLTRLLEDLRARCGRSSQAANCGILQSLTEESAKSPRRRSDGALRTAAGKPPLGKS